jgi:hypothetical protein
MDSILTLLIIIAFVCLIYSSIYYYYKYTNLLNTEILLYQIKSIFDNNPSLYPTFDPYKKITIETFLSVINTPEKPFVSYT